MSDPYVGELMCVGFNFAPNGWAVCQGQTMSISQNTALFSLLGTYYGGNGITTFALPDLRGRFPMGMGQAPGGTLRTIGDITGTETRTLLAANLPAHAHVMRGQSGLGTSADPTSHYPAGGGSYDTAANVDMGATGSTGAAQPVNIIPPTLVLNWIIALTGIYPPRS
jgi:microcystin-dependent protein